MGRLEKREQIWGRTEFIGIWTFFTKVFRFLRQSFLPVYIKNFNWYHGLLHRTLTVFSCTSDSILYRCSFCTHCKCFKTAATVLSEWVR